MEGVATLAAGAAAAASVSTASASGASPPFPPAASAGPADVSSTGLAAPALRAASSISFTLGRFAIARL